MIMSGVLVKKTWTLTVLI